MEPFSRYVPLLVRAYELWRKLEVDSGQSLLRIIGGLMIGPPGSELVARSTSSAEPFRLPIGHFPQRKSGGGHLPHFESRTTGLLCDVSNIFGR